MSLYTKYDKWNGSYDDHHDNIFQNVEIWKKDGDPNNGRTDQRLFLANPDNVYVGTFEGNFKIDKVSADSAYIQHAVLESADIKAATIENAEFRTEGGITTTVDDFVNGQEALSGAIQDMDGAWSFEDESQTSIITSINQRLGVVEVEARTLSASDVAGIDDRISNAMSSTIEEHKDLIDQLSSSIDGMDGSWLLSGESGLCILTAIEQEDGKLSFSAKQLSTSDIAGVSALSIANRLAICDLRIAIKKMSCDYDLHDGSYASVITSFTQERGQISLGAKALEPSDISGLSSYISSFVPDVDLSQLSVENKVSIGKILSSLKQEDGKIEYGIADLQLSDANGYSEITSSIDTITDQITTIDQSINEISTKTIDQHISADLSTLSCAYDPDKSCVGISVGGYTTKFSTKQFEEARMLSCAYVATDENHNLVLVLDFITESGIDDVSVALSTIVPHVYKGGDGINIGFLSSDHDKSVYIVSADETIARISDLQQISCELSGYDYNLCAYISNLSTDYDQSENERLQVITKLQQISGQLSVVETSSLRPSDISGFNDYISTCILSDYYAKSDTSSASEISNELQKYQLSGNYLSSNALDDYKTYSETRSSLSNDGYAISSQIPLSTSQLVNDSDFVTSSILSDINIGYSGSSIVLSAGQHTTNIDCSSFLVDTYISSGQLCGTTLELQYNNGSSHAISIELSALDTASNIYLSSVSSDLSVAGGQLEQLNIIKFDSLSTYTSAIHDNPYLVGLSDIVFIEESQLNAEDKTIINVGDPLSATDAANKRYVDNLFATQAAWKLEDVTGQGLKPALMPYTCSRTMNASNRAISVSLSGELAQGMMRRYMYVLSAGADVSAWIDGGRVDVEQNAVNVFYIDEIMPGSFYVTRNVLTQIA